MAEPILRMEGVSKSFPGVTALSKVDFDLYPGEVHVLIGENGAAKSTLIKLLAGVYPTDEGRFFLDGQPVAIESVRAGQELGVATIYQEMNLIPELTVTQNILLGREPRRAGRLLVDTDAARRQSAELLGSLGQHIDPDVQVKADIVGRPIGRMIVDAAASPSGGGWIHYMYPEPRDIFPMWKSTFVKRVTFPSGKAHIIGCGIYNMQLDKAFIEDVVGRAAALIAERGKDAFGQLRDRTGPFVFMDTYVFVISPEGTEL